MAPRPKATRSGELHIVRHDLAGLLAHDLKTPLAAISMNLDYVLGELGADAADGVRAAIDDCRSANQRAIRIVSDMADAVLLSSGERRPNLGEVDAAAALEGAVQRCGQEAVSREVNLRWDAEECLVQADADLLSRALERLLERALRHARAGDSVEATLRGTAIAIRVCRAHEDERCAAEPITRALATYFAEAALRAQGGAVWTETDADGALVYRVALPG
jgi:signal transduction histidine kinase